MPEDEATLTPTNAGATVPEPSAPPPVSREAGPSGPSTPSGPELIGPYRLLGTLGEGGMGTVYLAEQTAPVRRTVAVKVVKRGMDTAAVLRRFEAERQALAVMEHPGIARVLDAGATAGGRPYFVMEHVDGVPINRFCDDRRLPLGGRLDLFALVCDAVAHAHSKGVIHRDLKPGNVLVAEVDGRAVPKVIDFGVAKVTADTDAGGELVTAVGQIVGTPEYMSPEQAENGPAGIDTRTDVYALGVILYELLAGALPFEPKTLRTAAYDEVRRIIREQDPPTPAARVTALTARGPDQAERALRVADARQTKLGTLARTLRGELEWIPLKAMRKDRDRRYATVTDLAEDVRNYLAGRALDAAPESRVYLARKFARRHRPTLAAAATVLLAITLGGAAAAWQAVRATRAEREAVAQRREAVAQRDAARDAAAESAEHVRFLTDALTDADPERERGRSLTMAEFVDNAAAGIEGRYAGRPRVRAALLSTLAEVSLGDGQAARALPLVEEAESLLNDAGEDPTPAAVLRGWILDEQGRPAEALPILRAAHGRQLRSPGPDDARTLRTAFRLADVLDQTGAGDEARALFDDTLRRRARALGPDHPDTLASLNVRGAFEAADGDFDAAVATMRDALARRRRALPAGHPQAIHAANNLGVVLRRAGRAGEAAALIRGAVADAEAVLGRGHYQTARMRFNLARALLALDDAGGAERECLAAVRSLRRAFGDASPRAAAAAREVAALYRHLGRDADAARWAGDPSGWPPFDPPGPNAAATP